MAVDVYYSDNIIVGMISPRLSFSRDLDESNESTSNPINDYSCRIDSTFDFAFNVDTTIAFSSSSADELFSDGKIIPACLKHNNDEVKVAQQQVVSVMPCLDLPVSTVTEERKKSLKEFLEDSFEDEEQPNNASASASASASAAAKSFWQFRRSTSLNCDRNQRKGLIGSWKILSRSGSTGKFLEKIVEEEEEKTNTNFHTKLLRKFSRNNSMNNSENIASSCNVLPNKGLTGSSSSSKILRRSHSTSDKYFAKSDSKHFRRSNSTGSAPNTNKLKKQRSQKQQQNHQLPTQKGKVKDSFRGYYGSNNNNNHSSLKINPVLNLPSPYISRVSVDLFSFGSLFCNGAKERKNRK